MFKKKNTAFKCVSKNIKFDRILEAACLNGAKALEISDIYGSFEIGKKPGINLITDFDFETMNLTSSSQIYPLD